MDKTENPSYKVGATKGSRRSRVCCRTISNEKKYGATKEELDKLSIKLKGLLVKSQNLASEIRKLS
jgi:hypothetical protein